MCVPPTEDKYSKIFRDGITEIRVKKCLEERDVKSKRDKESEKKRERRRERERERETETERERERLQECKVSDNKKRH
jgi:hypothetical protein